MDRHEEGALGGPVLAGIPVYEVFADILQRPLGRCVGSSVHVLVTSSKGVSQTGWAHIADARLEAHRVKLFQAADCSMDSMRVEIMQVWTRSTPCKGSFLRGCVVIKSSPISHCSVMAT
jgi:hypothetical protein